MKADTSTRNPTPVVARVPTDGDVTTPRIPAAGILLQRLQSRGNITSIWMKRVGPTSHVDNGTGSRRVVGMIKHQNPDLAHVNKVLIICHSEFEGDLNC
jgi:hypothetical protein